MIKQRRRMKKPRTVFGRLVIEIDDYPHTIEMRNKEICVRQMGSRNAREYSASVQKVADSIIRWSIEEQKVTMV